jgi:mono/diheme cytochrome c family protein
MSGTGRAVRIAALLLCVVPAGCRQDMHDQPKYQPFERNRFFADQRASRPLVPGVVARGHLDEDAAFFTGIANGAPVTTNPLPLSRDTMLRGQERFNIYCSPCHDRVGSGEGMIVQRGYKQPPTFHSDRLRGVPDGYFFQVMTNGFGMMPSYAAQVPAHDRWAIVAYIRALQFSQHATVADVPASERAGLGATP